MRRRPRLPRRPARAETFRTAPRTGAATPAAHRRNPAVPGTRARAALAVRVWPRRWRGGRSRQVDQAAGNVRVLVQVVAGADPVVAVSDEQRESLLRLPTDEQDRREPL